MSTQRLETARVILLPWEFEDWSAFKPLATDPNVMRYISDGVPWPDSRIIEFVERQRTHFAELGYCLWKLMVKGSSAICGFCGIQPLDDLPGVEIGWWLAPHLWGQGFATEAARMVLEDGFTRCDLNRIVAIARRENGASMRVMEKIGMRYEGDALHHGIEVVLYAIEK
ncbi:MAG: GNAT family N-acetyltransferase [Candidatus Acidiferrum sp.]